jgi:hypothetical protein
VPIGTLFLRFAGAAAHTANRMTRCLFLALYTSGDCQYTRSLGSIVHSGRGHRWDLLGLSHISAAILYPVCFVVSPIRRLRARLHFSQVHLYGLRGRPNDYPFETHSPSDHASMSVAAVVAVVRTPFAAAN